MKACDRRFELHPDDELYPAKLRDLSDPPRTLFCIGNPEVLSTPSLAVIGSRRATPYGLTVAEMAATVAAESGVTVVSGGAIGCDQAAGNAALEAGGKHVLVFGCGADVIYPKRCAPLVRRALDAGGAVVAIAPWGTDPRPYAFPKRNRIIAALARAVCITEAAIPSGTFSTAEAALSLGREVLAAPGAILSPESRGTNRLIADGACALIDEESLEVAISRIFGVLRFCRTAPAADNVLCERDAQVMAALTASPLRAEEVASMLGISQLDALTLLSELSGTGRVERLLDGRFAPTKLALRQASTIMHNR